jgi:hypothetical protein
VIAIPQRTPLRLVGGLERAHDQRRFHRNSLQSGPT